MAELLLTNGNRNFNDEEGLLLTGEILHGKVKIGDLLIVNDSLKVPIINLHIESELFPGKNLFRISIPKEFNNSTNWSELYNSKLTTEE